MPAADALLAGCLPRAAILISGRSARWKSRTQIKIEQIRELRRQVGFHPLAGSWRVVLLKPAETLNEAAANALLKTLEEPPAGNLFILTAIGERDLLPTIVSRCRRLTFGAIPQSILVQELQNQKGLSFEQASLVAAINYGSLGRALAEDLPDLLAKRDQVVNELGVLQQGSTGEVLKWATEKGKKGTTWIALFYWPDCGIGTCWPVLSGNPGAVN